MTCVRTNAGPGEFMSQEADMMIQGTLEFMISTTSTDWPRGTVIPAGSVVVPGTLGTSELSPREQVQETTLHS